MGKVHGTLSQSEGQHGVQGVGGGQEEPLVYQRQLLEVGSLVVDGAACENGHQGHVLFVESDGEDHDNNGTAPVGDHVKHRPEPRLLSQQPRKIPIKRIQNLTHRIESYRYVIVVRADDQRSQSQKNSQIT
ncbi:hypothetical protein OJ252_1748 [Cryptosporidium canis]|uniref:Uncharacterized protein n=1 Tax=Cryptosporidium canis TaxID=195482 RepID=A0ABQ8P7H6_9CRYT|nr:hypothetical protein OJ252_1748 [Cryptosporidium canis]